MPTTEDVRVWMKMANTAKPGQVTIEEYECVVLESLRKAGFKIDKMSNSIVIDRDHR